MNKFHNFFSRYELPLFLLLTYVLSWWSAPFVKGQIMPQGPAVAALVVLGVAASRQGLSQWWRRITNWRISSIWFIAGPAIVLGYQMVGIVINLLLGAQLMGPPHISGAIVLELILLGGWLEEPGWSGYLLPKMRERFADRPNGLLLAALITGLFRGIWHLPLFLYGYLPWFDIFVFNFAFQLIIAWIFYRSGGSVLAVMFLHLTSNLIGSFTYLIFAGAAHTMYTALFMATACVVAVIIVATGGLSLTKSAEYTNELPSVH
jgi:hypothetical protein